MRVPRRRARRSAPLGAHRLTPVSVRTSRMSAAGRPAASRCVHPVRCSATEFREITGASRSTMISAWGNCSKACSESVRSLAMSPQYRAAHFRLQLLQPALQLQWAGAPHVLVEAGVADRLATEAGLEPVEPEPWVVRSRFFRDAPPVIDIAAHSTEIEHGLPVQQVVGDQLALLIAGSAEQVIGGFAEAKDHDPAENVTLVVGEIQPNLVRRPENLEHRLVVGDPRQVHALALAGLGRQLREGGDIARAAHPNALLFGEVQVVPGFRLKAGFQRVRVEIDAEQLRRLRLDRLALDESAPLEKCRPLVADWVVWLDSEAQ